MNTTDRDPTDLGLSVDIDNFARFRYPPRMPHPRPPVEDTVPASRPDLHVERIYKRMGWERDPAKRRACDSCLARPGAPCVTDTGKEMSGMHPGR